MLTLVRGDLHPLLAIELARRGRVWGERNADVLFAIRTGLTERSAFDGPSLVGLHGFLIEISSDRHYAHGYRRLAAPAP